MIEAPAIDDHLPRSLEMRGGAQGGFDVTGGARAYLKTVREHLESLHRSVASGREVNEAHSDLMDRLIRRLFLLSEELYFGAGGEGQSDHQVRRAHQGVSRDCARGKGDGQYERPGKGENNHDP